MKITKLNFVLSIILSIVLLSIVIVYSVIYFRFFYEASQIDSSPEASIEQYLSYETHNYKIINITLMEEKFREREYLLECECQFNNELNQATQKYKVHLIDDIGWVVTQMETIEN
ncbi:hypothetical protein ABGV42_03435 [Paenibacillus pabuli]|uniref:hypothetical protein n=1 Tax=Paenibacillus pabuli TaxID=1472 RepID=UPI003241C24B